MSSQDNLNHFYKNLESHLKKKLHIIFSQLIQTLIFLQLHFRFTQCQARIFWGVRTPPEIIFTPPEAFGTAPKSFCTPANYIYFDLIVSYLIILTTKFVKLPILWSQISPCRPRKQILLNFFLGLSLRCHQAPAKASSSI